MTHDLRRALLLIGWCGLAGLAAGSCGRAGDGDPFAGSGAFSDPGVIGAVAVSGGLGAKLFGWELPESFALWLDPELYGGSCALALTGADPGADLAALERGGWIAPEGSAGSERYRWGARAADLFGAMPSGPGLERLARVAPGAQEAALQRLEQDGRIGLAPTVDLAGLLFGAARAGAGGLPDGADLAAALDGAAFAKFLDDRLSIVLDSAGLVARFDADGVGARIQTARAGLKAALELLAQVEGVVLLLEAPGAELHGRARISLAPGSAAADVARALRPLGGGAGAGFELAFDPGQVAAALVRLSEMEVLRASGIDPAPLRAAAADVAELCSGRLRIAGAGELALSLAAAADPRSAAAAAERLAMLAGGDCRVEGTWLVCGSSGAAVAGGTLPVDAGAVASFRSGAGGGRGDFRAELRTGSTGNGLELEFWTVP